MSAIAACALAVATSFKNLNRTVVNFATNQKVVSTLCVPAVSFLSAVLLVWLPFFLLFPLLTLFLAIILYRSTLSKRSCLQLYLLFYLIVSFLNLLVDSSIIYSAQAGDFQAYYTHSLDLNPSHRPSSYISPVNSLWLTEPVIRIFYYLSSTFTNENLYLVSLSTFFVFSYLCICFRLTATKNQFVALSFLVFSFKVPYFVQGAWLVRQDISWLFFWLFIISNGQRSTRIICFILSVLSHNSTVAMYALFFISYPFKDHFHNLFRGKIQLPYFIKPGQFFIRLSLASLLFILLVIAYSLIGERGSFETNSLITTSPPVFVYIYSLIACLIFFFNSNSLFSHSFVLSDSIWALFVATLFGLALIPFGGILSLRQASGVVIVAPILLIRVSWLYLSSKPNLQDLYNFFTTALFLFSCVRLCFNLYNPAVYQLYLVPITHSNLFQLLSQV
jgi:hypothetical protein